MTQPTPQQFQRARRLLQSTARKAQRVAELRRLIHLCRKAADDREHVFAVRTNYQIAPDKLGDAISLFQRGNAATADLVRWRYHEFLQTLHKSPEPGARPRHVDYAKLCKSARPCLLAPYLGILIGDAFPRLCLERSDPIEGRLVYITSGGPADPEPWRAQLPAINAWLGDHWAVTGASATTVTLTRQQPLPKIIPYAPDMLQKGALFIGIDTTTQAPLYIPFSELVSGTYMPGTSGSGKSNALHILTQSLFRNLGLFSAIYLVDGKHGVAMQRYADIAPGKVHVLYDEPEVWDLTRELTQLMRQRNAHQRDTGIDKATRDFVAVVIDEMATYTAKPSSNNKSEANKRHAAFLDDLAKLAGRGRSTGLRLFITSQRPVDAQIPMTVRANCQQVIAFRLNNTTDATMVFDELSPGADPRKLAKGQALIRDDQGETRQVQFPLAPEQTKRGPS